MRCWRTNKVLMAGLVLMCVPDFSYGQTQSFVSYTGEQAIELRKGKEEVVKLRFTIQDDFYIQGHNPANEYFIPTELTITASEGILVGDIHYPEPIKYYYADEAVELDIYKNTVVMIVPIQVSDTLVSTADLQVHGSLHYQACSKTKCYYPRNLTFMIRIQVKS